MRVFGAHPYDGIHVEQLAAEAGISAGLLYHYFPSKRDYYLAVVQEAIREIASLTATRTAADAWDGIAAGVAAYLEHAQRHPMGFLTAHRGAMSSDEEIRRLLAAARARQRGRVLRALGLTSPAAKHAVDAWIAMVYDLTAASLTDPSLDRATATTALVGALRGAITPIIERG